MRRPSRFSTVILATTVLLLSGGCNEKLAKTGPDGDPGLSPQFADRPPEQDPADRLEPTWASVSRNIFAPKCLVCHGPAGQANFLDLSTPDTLKGPAAGLVDVDDPEASELIAIIRDPDEPMPPRSSNIPPLSETEVQVLIEWIRRGLP